MASNIAVFFHLALGIRECAIMKFHCSWVAIDGGKNDCRLCSLEVWQTLSVVLVVVFCLPNVTHSAPSMPHGPREVCSCCLSN